MKTKLLKSLILGSFIGIFLLVSNQVIADEMLWTEDGEIVCNVASYNNYGHDIASDTDGNSLVVWADNRSGDHDIYIQLFDSDGDSQLGLGNFGMEICDEPTHNAQINPQIVSVEDGYIIAWEDYRGDGTTTDIYAQKIDLAGYPLWTDHGVPICAYSEQQNYFNLIHDDSGGAIIVWFDQRDVDIDGTNDNNVYMQRVDQDGNRLWENIEGSGDWDGIPVSDAGYIQWYPEIISDGEGGAIISWSDFRNGTDLDIYAQRIDSDGSVHTGWDPDAELISDASGHQVAPELCNDGNGGAYIVWADYRNDNINNDGSSDIYAQRISNSGNTQFSADDVCIADQLNHQIYPRIVEAIDGGAIIAWYDQRDGNDNLYIQNINDEGQLFWEPGNEGIHVTDTYNANFDLLYNSSYEEVTIVWDSSSSDIYTQQYDTSGNALLDPCGLPVCDATDDQTEPHLTQDESCGSIIAWLDNRGSDEDIYVHRLGIENPPSFVDPPVDPEVDEGNLLEFTLTTTDIEDPSPDITYDISPFGFGITFTDNGDGTGDFSWEPSYSQADTYEIEFTVTDNDGLFDIFTMTITVNENVAPEFVPESDKSVNEGDLLEFVVTATDPNGTIPFMGVLVPSIPNGATYQDHGDGTLTFSWTPDYDNAGIYTNVTFVALDGEPLGVSEEIDIVVHNVNRVPTIDHPGDYSINEGENLTFTVTATDPDGDSLTLWIEWPGDAPDGATFTDNEDNTGTFDWTPNYEQEGGYYPEFYASDGNLEDDRDIEIIVDEFNPTPVIDFPGDQEITEGDHLTLTVNASDPDGNIPVLTAPSLPTGSTFFDNGNGTGTFDWDTTYSAEGNHNATFRATDIDDSGLFNETSIEIAVSDNDAPTLDSINDQTLDEGEGIIVEVSATDPEGAIPSLSASNLPADSSFTDRGDGTGYFSWTTDNDSAGEHTVTITAQDGEPLEDSVDFTITVNDVPEDEGENNPQENDQTIWYLAEGSTANGFTTYILVVNPNKDSADIEITFMNEQAETVTIPDTIDPYSRATYIANTYMPDEAGVSTTVECTNEQRIVVERAMYWDVDDMHWAGGHDNVGQTQAYNTLFLAEGSTYAFETFVLIQNPGPDTADVEITYMDNDGNTYIQNKSIAGYSRFTQKINKIPEMDNKYGVSTQIESTEPVIAERSMYWDYADKSRIGGHCASAVPEANPEWFLAEGSADGFELWILVMNPGDDTASCRATFMLNDGTTEVMDFLVSPTSRFSINGNTIVSSNAVSTKIESNIPVIAERAMYWDSNEIVRAGGHCNSGATSDTTSVYFAEGYTGDSFSEWICIQNPHDTDVTLDLSFMTDTGDIVTDNITVSAHSRYTVDVNTYVTGDVSAMLEVVSGDGIIAERAMYWDSIGINSAGEEQTYEWIGGHCSGRNDL